MRPPTMVLRSKLVMIIGLALLACGGGEREPAAGKPAEAPARQRPSTARPADPTQPAGELFHATDRKIMQGFMGPDLAVGGSYVYWIEQLRIDRNGLAKTTVHRKRTTGHTDEVLDGLEGVHAVAADATRLYAAGPDKILSYPHAGGHVDTLAPGRWSSIVVGDTQLLLAADDRLALVAKAGGPVEVVWEGKRGNHALAADGDRFYAIDRSYEAPAGSTRQILRFTRGDPQAVVADLAEVRGELGVAGEHLYFAGPAKQALSGLWRVAKTGGAAEQVGDTGWGFADFVIRDGTLYGMVFTGKWHLQKLDLATPGAQPVVVDHKPMSGMVTTLAADATHVYYLTSFDVKRVPR